MCHFCVEQRNLKTPENIPLKPQPNAPTKRKYLNGQDAHEERVKVLRLECQGVTSPVSRFQLDTVIQDANNNARRALNFAAATTDAVQQSAGGSCDNHDLVQSRNKCKRKLSFNGAAETNTYQNGALEDSLNVKKMNCIESDAEFSNSVDDDFYLVALDCAEKEFGLNADKDILFENSSNSSHICEPTLSECNDSMTEPVISKLPVPVFYTNTNSVSAAVNEGVDNIDKSVDGVRSETSARKLPSTNTSTPEERTTRSASPIESCSGLHLNSTPSPVRISCDAKYTPPRAPGMPTQNSGTPNKSHAMTVSPKYTPSRFPCTPNHNSGTPNKRHFTSMSPSTPSYKLTEIHARVFGERPKESHKAEDDCVTLVKVAKQALGFMEWVDLHAKPLSVFDKRT